MQSLRQSGWVERRDDRHKVLIRGRMRAGGLPVDVCIRNISPRGLMAQAGSAPPRGTIIEITDTVVPIVGTVTWSSGGFFGVSLRGRLDLRAFLAGKARAVQATGQDVAPAPRQPARAAARTAEASRTIGSRMQYLFFAASAVAAACGLAQAAYAELANATSQVVQALP